MKKPVLYLLIILLVFCSCSNKDDSNKVIEEGCNYQPTGWDYPVKGEDFRAMGGLEQAAVIRIPEEVLDTLSPEDAVRLFITFPEFHVAAAYGQLSIFSWDISRFKIIEHLFSRDDVGSLLIAAYNDLDFDIQGFKTLPYCVEQLGDFSMCWALMRWFQALLSQKEILQNMTHDERLELIKVARPKKTGNGRWNYCIIVNILCLEEYPEFMTSPNREAIVRCLDGDVSYYQYINSDWYDGLQYDETARIADNFINDNKK